MRFRGRGRGTDRRTDRRKPEKIALCGIIGHRPLQGRCPSHHLIPTYTNLGASGTADHVTLLRLFSFIHVFESARGKCIIQPYSVLATLDIFFLRGGREINEFSTFLLRQNEDYKIIRSHTAESHSNHVLFKLSSVI